MGAERFEIAVAAPFRLDLTIWALRRRVHNLVDNWDGTFYSRVAALSGRSVLLRVCQEPRRRSPVLTVEVRSGLGTPKESEIAAARRLLTTMLGLEADIWGFYALAERDRRLATLAERFVGMRPPRFASVFEAAVNAIACQQLSLAVGIHLLNRLATRYGPRAHLAETVAGFPGPERLAKVDPGELRALGFSWAKATAVVALAQGVTSGVVDLEGLARLDDPMARASLLSLLGIGRWSAEYVLLRGLGRLEVLPGDDVGARNSLRRRFELAPGAGYGDVAALSQAWWPFAGLVYFHLLLDGLAAAGHINTAFDGAPLPEPMWPPAPHDAAAMSEGGAVA